MNALLLVAHGSRRQKSNDEVRSLVEKLNHHCADQFSIIDSAFLELEKPLIPEGIKRCISDGAESVVVLPYFLNSGRHVLEDIPDIVDSIRKEFPHVDIIITPHIGASDKMLDIVISMANAN